MGDGDGFMAINFLNTDLIRTIDNYISTSWLQPDGRLNAHLYPLHNVNTTFLIYRWLVCHFLMVQHGKGALKSPIDDR